MRKSLKVIENEPLAERDEMELLVPRGKSRTPRGSSFGSRVKLHLVLFVFGFIGTISCLWAMLDTHNSKAKIQELGLHKVANSLENILSLLAYPVLMFTAILAVYAGQQLFRLYRIANSSETYRRGKSR